MEDRLIKESDVRELFEKLEFTDKGQRIQFGMMLGNLLDKCPTSYNVENVVEELELHSFELGTDTLPAHYVRLNDAIEIVKGDRTEGY